MKLTLKNRFNKLVFKEGVRNKNPPTVSGKLRIICCHKNYRRKKIPDFFLNYFIMLFYPFYPFSTLNFTLTKRGFFGTCLAKVFLFFFPQTVLCYFYHKKDVSLCTSHITSSEISFLHLWDYCWKWEFYTDAKIKQKRIIPMMENK